MCGSDTWVMDGQWSVHGTTQGTWTLQGQVAGISGPCMDTSGTSHTYVLYNDVNVLECL